MALVTLLGAIATAGTAWLVYFTWDRSRKAEDRRKAEVVAREIEKFRRLIASQCKKAEQDRKEYLPMLKRVIDAESPEMKVTTTNLRKWELLQFPDLPSLLGTLTITHFELLEKASTDLLTEIIERQQSITQTLGYIATIASSERGITLADVRPELTTIEELVKLSISRIEQFDVICKA